MLFLGLTFLHVVLGAEHRRFAFAIWYCKVAASRATWELLPGNMSILWHRVRPNSVTVWLCVNCGMLKCISNILVLYNELSCCLEYT
jgi:hypothetical protein